MSKLKSLKLGFLTVVAAGALVMLGTFVLPATQTFGLETDAGVDDPISGQDTDVPAVSAPATTAPSTTAPSTALPPAAPVGQTGATALPSAGSGGYLNSGSQSAFGFALVGLGIALVGSGTAVWAYGRKR